MVGLRTSSTEGGSEWFALLDGWLSGGVVEKSLDQIYPIKC